MGLGEVAAAIHRDMCDDAANGYSWSPRWGEDGKGVKTLKIDGVEYSYDRGSYDCSSSTITAWKSALSHTKYRNMLDGATFTGNMKDVFLASGLFVWRPMSFLAEPGDLYLNIANHVAMCQTQYPDVLSEFSSNESGGAYGGQVGDQTGWESHVTGFYDYPWDGILHYNGKADYQQEGWVYQDGGWWYRYADGSYPASEWADINGEWYYFDANGWMQTGWLDWKGKRYYLLPESDDTGTHFGYMVTGFQQIKNRWYAFDSSGALVKDDKLITVNAKTGVVKIA